MAERRMFAKTIINSDAFLDMPQSTQLLYFHLSLSGDDDGFVNKPKTIMRMIGCKDDDFKILIAKKFIIPFDTGVVVIKHWKIHNFIAKDRYTETKYKNEKSMLDLDENKAYTATLETVSTECIQDVNTMDTQVRLGKVSIGKVNKDLHELPKFTEDSTAYGIAEYLFLKIQSSNPNIKKPNMQSWAGYADKMLRIDNRSKKDIKIVIDFATTDSFWQSNILSTKKLKEKFDTLYIQATKPRSNNQSKSKLQKQIDDCDEWLSESEE